jgi:hypothetical protein
MFESALINVPQLQPSRAAEHAPPTSSPPLSRKSSRNKFLKHQKLQDPRRLNHRRKWIEFLLGQHAEICTPTAKTQGYRPVKSK